MVFWFDLIHVSIEKFKTWFLSKTLLPVDPRLQNSTTEVTLKYLYEYLLFYFRFISARLLSVKSINPSEYINELDTFLLDISIVSLIACLWVMFVFINSKKWNQMPHLVTMGLAFAQVCGCIGKNFSNFSCLFLNPNIFPIWILIFLIY